MTSLNHWQFNWARSRVGLEIKKLTGKNIWEIDELKEIMGSHLLKRASDDKVKNQAIIFIAKHKAGLTKPEKQEEKIMITATPVKKNKNPHLTKQQKLQVRALHKTGLSYNDIAAQMGIGYWQAAHAVKRKISTRGPYNKQTKATKQETPVVIDSGDNSLTWKQKYLKAVSLLVEHDIIEVTL